MTWQSFQKKLEPYIYLIILLAVAWAIWTEKPDPDFDAARRAVYDTR